MSTTNNNNNKSDEELKSSPSSSSPSPNKKRSLVNIKKGEFDPENHFYQKAMNAQVSSVVSFFMHLNNERIVQRYCHLNPNVDVEKLREILNYKPKHFLWAGGDLFNVTTQQGNRKMVIVETNSCPSGQKSMPLLAESDEFGSYRKLIEHTFKPLLEEKQKEGLVTIDGKLAVVYDKNKMEASGYAATLAEVFQEEIVLVEYYHNDEDAPVRFVKDTSPSCDPKDDRKVMQARDSNGQWVNIRAAFRYVTQKPWTRLPLVNSKTMILNPIITCLSGGRNKLVAAKAYDFLNAELAESGLKILVPKTIRDVSTKELPLWIKTFGGFAVVKNPYSNAGQGVWTITNDKELEEFMKINHYYDQFIVQSLIGNANWSSNVGQSGQYFHVGTVPDKNNHIYVADLRMMIHYNFEAGGFSPLALYARKAAKPLTNDAPENSWEVLGTNLSIKKGDNSWDSDTKRLLIVDRRDFNKLGIGVDDLIDAYIQTVLSGVAIDKLSARLMKNETFDMELFSSLDKDDSLISEILV